MFGIGCGIIPVEGLHAHRRLDGVRVSASSAYAVLLLVGALGAAVAFVGLIFGANALLSPRNPNPEKLEPYECGMPPAGDPHVRFPIRYAAVAVLFVIFDVEAVLLFAVATKLHGSVAGALSVLAFSSMLALGLGYAWKTGALKWRS
jgi:NADH-quinone oxidoreductase subunit A